jgi:hypothetical protein
MANDTAADWDESSPAITDPRKDGAREIRVLRAGLADRLDIEHTAMAAFGAGGAHRPGSAKAYHQGAAPTTKPDGVTPLAASDTGRFWLDSDTDYLYIYDHPSWVVVSDIRFPVLSSFYEEPAQSLGSPPSYPVTKGSLTAGTYLVVINGLLSDAAADDAAFNATFTINGTTRTIHMDKHPGGTVPFSYMIFVTAIAGAVSVTAVTNIYRIQSISGILISVA